MNSFISVSKMLFKNSKIFIFWAGAFIGLFLWLGIIDYIKDKPVPNAIFSQSILDAKITAVQNLDRAPRVFFVGGSNVLFGLIPNNFPRSLSFLLLILVVHRGWAES